MMGAIVTYQYGEIPDSVLRYNIRLSWLRIDRLVVYWKRVIIKKVIAHLNNHTASKP